MGGFQYESPFPEVYFQVLLLLVSGRGNSLKLFIIAKQVKNFALKKWCLRFFFGIFGINFGPNPKVSKGFLSLASP